MNTTRLTLPRIAILPVLPSSLRLLLARKTVVPTSKIFSTFLSL